MVYLSKIPLKTRYRLILGFFSCIFLLIWWSIFPQIVRSLSGENDLTIRFYDVGQGDAVLIQYQSTQIIVDGGPDERILTYLGRDLLPWDREIELLVLTHPQADHLTGLLGVLERYEVKNVLYYPSLYNTKGYQRFLDLIAKEGSQIFPAQAGEQLSVAPIQLQVIWPTANYRDLNINNESVILLVRYANFTLFLPGDIEEDAQEKLSVSYDVDLVKMAHHGAQSGLYPPLLQAIAPNLAIISAGRDNRYGHPHSQTLAALRQLGIPYLRTDLNGTITIRSDGEDFWYDTDR